MRPVPLVRTTALWPLLDYLDRGNAPGCASLRFSPAVLRDPNALVPLASGGHLWEEAARAEDAEDLGLIVGERTGIERAGPLGGIVRQAPTVAAGLETAVRLGARLNTGQRFRVTLRRDDIVWEHHFAPALRHGRQQVDDFVMLMMVKFIRLAAGPSWRPTEILREGKPPHHAEQIAALASGSVHFGQPHTGLVFPRPVLALRIPPAVAPRSARSEPGAAAAEALPDVEFAGSVRQAVDALLRLGSLRLETAAEAAGTSVRSFQRRLSEAGLTFGQLVDAARFDTARAMLADPEVRIIEISTRLGYNDSANFTRAFRRWTGLAPRTYRRLAASDSL